MKTVYQDDGWRLPDELWSRMEVLLPAAKPHPLGRPRPRVLNRSAMDAVFVLLRTGMQWKALDATGICSSSSAYRRFREWIDAGVFTTFWKQGLLRCEELHRCTDLGYDSQSARYCARLMLRQPCLPRRKKPGSGKSNPMDWLGGHGGRTLGWVVERSRSWLNRFLRLLIRWESGPTPIGPCGTSRAA